MAQDQAKSGSHPIKKFLFVTLIGLVAAMVLSTALFFSSWKGFLVASLISVTIWLTQWYGQGYIYDFVDRKFGWRRRVPLRLTVHILLSVMLASFGVPAVVYFYSLLFGFGGQSYWKLFTDMALIASLISLGISVIMAAIGFYRSMKQAIIERERLRSEMLNFKYESLRNQINPHFLFNSLNVLTSLVEEEPKLAVKFIRQLSEVYRYVLDSRHKDLIGLDEEVEFIESFVFLLKTRFEEGLEVNIDVPADQLKQSIVPMSLQLLVENAVKHNEVSASQPLTILITAKDDRIQVSNKKKSKVVPVDSKKVGLENIRQRYEHFTDELVLVAETDEDFNVSLPLLKVESSVTQLKAV